MLVMHPLALFTNRMQNIWKEDIPSSRQAEFLVVSPWGRAGPGSVFERDARDLDLAHLAGPRSSWLFPFKLVHHRPQLYIFFSLNCLQYAILLYVSI
jgi:hypothetical protein